MPTLIGRLSLAGLVAFGAGALTSYLQAVLPYAVAPLANSAGSWCVVAFALAWWCRGAAEAAVTGALALGLLVAGYYAAAHLRGFAVSPTSVTFWCAAAVTVGPALGAAAVAVRRGRGTPRLAAALLLPLLLVVEGVRSLAQIADTTSSAYWTGQIVLGVLMVPTLLVLGQKTPVR